MSSLGNPPALFLMADTDTDASFMERLAAEAVAVRVAGGREAAQPGEVQRGDAGGCSRAGGIMTRHKRYSEQEEGQIPSAVR
jgi:hypothetical protein